MDNLDQPVRAHPSFFIPLELKLPQEDVDALNNGIIQQLQTQHLQSQRLWFNSSHAVGHDFAATRRLADAYLKPMGLCTEVMGVFVVNANIYDRNIHSDSARLETRLNFYQMAQSPGVVRWFPDTGDGYESYNKNLDGVEFLDYTWPWVADFKSNKLSWEDIPDPIWSTSTACASALVRTDLPHHVIQGPGLRITITCRVVDSITGSTQDTWRKIKS